MAVLFKLILAIQFNLYLLNHDSSIGDQSVVPLTAERKKHSWWRTFRQKKWKEDLDITLMDYEGQAFTYQIKYHLWKGFYLILKSAPSETRLNDKPILANKKYYLRTGMELVPGNRRFTILVTTAPLDKIVQSIDAAQELKASINKMI